jgi:hypothetical protein
VTASEEEWARAKAPFWAWGRPPAKQVDVHPWESPPGDVPLWTSELEVAWHIRGKVLVGTRSGGNPSFLGYWWKVVNAATGETLISCDAFGLDDAISACREAVQALRIADFYGQSSKAAARTQPRKRVR